MPAMTASSPRRLIVLRASVGIVITSSWLARRYCDPIAGSHRRQPSPAALAGATLVVRGDPFSSSVEPSLGGPASIDPACTDVLAGFVPERLAGCGAVKRSPAGVARRAARGG